VRGERREVRGESERGERDERERGTWIVLVEEGVDGFLWQFESEQRHRLSELLLRNVAVAVRVPCASSRLDPLRETVFGDRAALG
jgi:hypothetical protein